METREAIKNTFVDLASRKPIDKITVREIVETCGVNRNSFYYHFEDMNDLVEKVIDEMFIDPDNAWADQELIPFACSICRRINENRDLLANAYFSKNHQLFELRLLNLLDSRLRQYFAYHVFSRMNLSSEQEDLVIYQYKCLLMGMIADWMNKGMSYDFEKRFKAILTIDRLGISRPLKP